MTNDTENETRGKECSNLVVLLSELYNFQVVSCLLVYDIIRGLLDSELTEFKVELSEHGEVCSEDVCDVLFVDLPEGQFQGMDP